VAEIISFLPETVLVIAYTVQIAGVVLKVIEHRHDSAVLVVWEQRLKTNVLKTDATI